MGYNIRVVRNYKKHFGGVYMSNIYQINGYKNRKEYLVAMAEEYGVDEETVFLMADMLGKDEDFDGLISMLEDYEAYINLMG